MGGPKNTIFVLLCNMWLLLLLNPFYGVFSGTTWVSQYQKGKTSLGLNEARDDGALGWQWHQLDHMQTICTSLQTDNHTNTSLFLTPNRQCQSTAGHISERRLVLVGDYGRQRGCCRHLGLADARDVMLSTCSWSWLLRTPPVPRVHGTCVSTCCKWWFQCFLSTPTRHTGYVAYTPSHTYTNPWSIAACVAWSVCLSVCLSACQDLWPVAVVFLIFLCMHTFVRQPHISNNGL